MFCPECQSEFTADVSFCKDCRVFLMEKPQKLENVAWSPVKEYAGYIPAEMAKVALEEQDIPSFIKGDFLSTAYGIKAWETAGGKAVLFVPEGDAERATLIVENIVTDN
ncbi:MAG TPA: DUF2007 domain-containing protein [Candidatus Marinimicrobia bacterium]|jgi:hypothetical protein|nr:DUF2007 domain-containing protein [Candidatus Neomarinimicrobiota bacterium]HIB02269.1 DUF2007 domain-containing protein [Candidatus Neomarinimicrobiota bacterium]HIB71769.1 DUF2007 domain-containing protein [Candidatus Neomarinimicrobiota bacterium]HIB95266.1 DUF2007 domain-containing protein [Candidatus Neomarinimicrobiota bacterium]HIC74273.1 DUF2007 domain-containing protein [Candidatus Neomarinimicrobiota bacterium]